MATAVVLTFLKLIYHSSTCLLFSWTWNNLQKHLTDSMYLTLETSVLDEFHSKSTTNNLNLMAFSIKMIVIEPNGNELHQEPPIPVTSVHKLRCLQKKAHEILTKCKDVCYCCTDIKVLEDTLSSAEKIYCNIVVSADPKNATEVLPSFPLLSQSSVSESSKRSKSLCRSKPSEQNAGPPKKRFKATTLFCKDERAR